VEEGCNEVELDTTSHIPKYAQIRNWIQAMISRGRIRKGDKLPTEEELAKMFNVNRMTVRQAIDTFVIQKMVVRQRGRGTFLVNEKPQELVYELDNITSFTDKMKTMGITPSTQTYESDVIEATDEIADILQLGSDRRVVYLWRAKLANREPVLIQRHYLPYQEFKDILEMDINQSLYHLLVEEFAITLHHSTQIFSASLATEEDQKIFGIFGPFPCIVLESVIYDESNIPIELLYSTYRGDRYRFEVHSGQYIFQK